MKNRNEVINNFCFDIYGLSFKLTHNGLGLGEEGELKAQMLNKPQMLIEVQMFNLALLPLFCQTLVRSPFCPQQILYY